MSCFPPLILCPPNLLQIYVRLLYVQYHPFHPPFPHPPTQGILLLLMGMFVFQSQAARQRAIELSRKISNAYENKQNIAQTLVNTALLTANAAQLKSVIKRSKTTEVDFYYFLIFCLVGSILLQIISSLCMYIAGKLDSLDPDNDRKIYMLNTVSTLLIMMYKILNIFVAVFQTD